MVEREPGTGLPSEADTANALEKDTGQMKEQEPMLDDQAHGVDAAPAKRPIKFMYSSGAKPLDGYTIKRGVGVGGFGEVYFATSDGGKEVALKRIQRNLDIELRGVRHCLNLKHINLIDLYDIRHDHEGGAWVVMEFVAGDSLKDVLDRNPNGLPHDEALRWFEGIAKGVGCLHDHGIVHRDLKPANVFQDGDIVKIGDYGLSKFISCSRRSGQTESVGTFHYMAPEIGKGVYGKEIDVYALGIMLYELLTGRVPFDGESSQEIIMKHLTSTPEVDDTPQPFRSVIRRALQKDPDCRYSSVHQMLEDLQHPEGAAIVIGESPDNKTEQKADPPPVRPPIRTLMAPSQATAHGLSQAPAPRHSQARRPTSRPMAEETFYITEDGVGDGMVMGPVRRGPGAGRATATPHGGARATTSLRQQPRRIGKHLNTWPTLVKIVLLLLLCSIAAATQSAALVVVSGVLLVAYAGRTAIAAGAEGAETLQKRSQEVRKIRGQLANSHQQRPSGENLSEFLGAMLFSAVACGVIALLAVALADMPLNRSIGTWSLYLWLSLVSTAGTWVVLAAGKAWECHEGDGWLRRFVMLTAGLGLGIAAYGSCAFLGVNFGSQRYADVSPVLNYQAWYQAGQPMLPAFLAYFGGVFGVLQWWGQVDPLRNARFSLFATGLTVLWAWLLHTVFYFPQPWGVVIAGAISVASQLAAPWMTPADRSKIQDSQESIA